MNKAISPLYKSTVIAICVSLMIWSVALAASGDLDTTFSGDGKIIQGFGGAQHRGYDVAVQADGKVVVVGEKWLSTGRDYAIARYNSNGSLDTTFSLDGRQVISIGVSDLQPRLAIQADGKIVVGGQTCNEDYTLCDVAVARLTSEGQLDPSFSGDGKTRTDFGVDLNGGWDLAMQGNKIVIAGYYHDGSSYNAAVYRYNASGGLDATFSGDGILPINYGMEEFLSGIAIYAGKIYVVGESGPLDMSTTDFIVARINNDGTLDSTFSLDGKVKTNLGGSDYPAALAISGGKVVVVGTSDNSSAIVQYTDTGVLDTAFSNDGKLKANFGFSSPDFKAITIQSGKIIAVGQTGGLDSDALLVRYTSAGVLDTTFSTDGIVTTDWGGSDNYSSVEFKNSRIYVVGRFINASNLGSFIVAAYLP